MDGHPIRNGVGRLQVAFFLAKVSIAPRRPSYPKDAVRREGEGYRCRTVTCMRVAPVSIPSITRTAGEAGPGAVDMLPVLRSSAVVLCPFSLPSRCGLGRRLWRPIIC